MTFKIKCAGVTQNIFSPEAVSYQPNAWAILRDLNVNTVRIGGGVEGRTLHININYDAEWAQNLDRILAEAATNGIKVFFLQMGNKYDTMFGINCPEPDQGIAGTPIDIAKIMIDQLAGNNALSHNFITDPRLVGWSVSNEVYIGDPTVLDWNIQILDYIRSKGGKAWLSCPFDNTAPSYSEGIRFQRTEPILRGHVDFLEIHYYGVGIATAVQNEGGNVYPPVYNWAKPLLQDAVNGRGTMPIENLILGEFGIWRGYGADVGVGADITDETRRDYYRGVFGAARDVGFQNISFHDCFAQKSDGAYLVPMYSVVDVDGTYFPLVADVIKATYPSTQYLTIVTLNGQTNPAQGTYEIDKNAPVTITATPNVGYKFKQWLVDNAQAGATPFITVTMDTNHTVIAEFELELAVTPTQAGFPIWTIPVVLGGLGVMYILTKKK